MRTHTLAATGVIREARIAESAGFVIAITSGGDATALEARLTAALTSPRDGEGDHLQVGGGGDTGAVAAAPARSTAQARSSSLQRVACPSQRGISGIISFGLCGALAPGLQVGDWVIGSGVTGGLRSACHPGWTHRLLNTLRHPEPNPGSLPLAAPTPPDGKARRARSRVRPGLTMVKGTVHHGPVFADGALAATPRAKAELHARTGALAIDMESHVAARVAAAHNLPFACLRVVSDRAVDPLPPAFGVAMHPDGSTDIAAILLSLLKDPAQLSAFVRAAGCAARALRRLKAAAMLVGPGLGAPSSTTRNLT